MVLLYNRMKIQKMKAHAGSETHTRYVEAELLAKKRRINRTSFKC